MKTTTLTIDVAIHTLGYAIGAKSQVYDVDKATDILDMSLIDFGLVNLTGQQLHKCSKCNSKAALISPDGSTFCNGKRGCLNLETYNVLTNGDKHKIIVKKPTIQELKAFLRENGQMEKAKRNKFADLYEAAAKVGTVPILNQKGRIYTTLELHGFIHDWTNKNWEWLSKVNQVMIKNILIYYQ